MIFTTKRLKILTPNDWTREIVYKNAEMTSCGHHMRFWLYLSAEKGHKFVVMLLAKKSTLSEYSISQLSINTIFGHFIRLEADEFDYTLVFDFAAIALLMADASDSPTSFSKCISRLFFI